MRFSPTGIGEPKHMLYGASCVVKLKATPTQIQNGGVQSGCNWDLRIRIIYQRISGETAMFEVQKHGRASANTLLRQDE